MEWTCAHDVCKGGYSLQALNPVIEYIHQYANKGTCQITNPRCPHTITRESHGLFVSWTGPIRPVNYRHVYSNLLLSRKILLISKEI